MSTQEARQRLKLYQSCSSPAGPEAEKHFDLLLDSCAALDTERGLQRIEAGVNLGCSAVFRRMLQRGFRIDIQGVAMHRPDSDALNPPHVFLVNDWR